MRHLAGQKAPGRVVSAECWRSNAVPPPDHLAGTRRRAWGHFVENIGEEDIEMLKIFRADALRGFSFFQWLGETPKKLIVDHLFADDDENAKKLLESISDPESDPIRKVAYEKEGRGSDGF
ncbi:hypothetical protein D7B24_002195 [Verticillium nonalfalfae]|uniref:Uncharacterized protein n=1 Tax=Verticillium nonalfalfae TaxID=1051616 RepID=A0A3M9YHB9_9PEZI|nr:uncharacterized protein D7B24_002195 [Verticillium nonalfalfae]RNJ59585.1 hypothetical protein D7B24_002195 [Verticillium nonalfalfae]